MLSSPLIMDTLTSNTLHNGQATKISPVCGHPSLVNPFLWTCSFLHGILINKKMETCHEQKTVYRRKERTNRLSRGGRDNSLGSAASAADFVILSYCFCFDKQFFCDQELQSEKRQPSLGKVTVAMIKPDIHS